MRHYTSPSPYVNRQAETDPLVSGEASRRRSCSLDQYIWTTFVAILAMAIACVLYALVFPLSSCNNPLDSDVRDRIRNEWDTERRQHQGEVLRRIDIEQRWRVEDDERIHLREQWMREIEEHNRDIKERKRREEEERLKLNMFWTDPESHTCTTYGTREYTARPVNVPGDYNRRGGACMATPIQVHGVEYKTEWCEDYGPSNVIGHWDVDQHELDCASYWNWYKDLGCVSPGSGQRLIGHYLENLPQGADWREFCATTPANFRGMHLIGAELFCFQKGFGTYGQWSVNDEYCN